MKLNEFIVKDEKRLRLGYTTGSCAAAAAKASAVMLLTGRPVAEVRIQTPRGIELALEVECAEIGSDWAECCVTKDAGDDPDATDGIRIFTRVRRTNSGISIDGGEGIGQVTKPGLDQPVGSAAINSVPRKMIERELRAVLCEFGKRNGKSTGLSYDAGETGEIGEIGLSVVISAPQGIEVAKKTFNPRLGIVGGISILGTTGIVSPMSDEAILDTVRTEIGQRAALGRKFLLLTPGNYGEEYLRQRQTFSEDLCVTCSNFIGEAFGIAAEAQFRGVLLVGHIGKIVKLAGGLVNTHSRFGDCRAEIFAAHSAKFGIASGTAGRILTAATADEMIRILDEEQSPEFRTQVIDSILHSACDHLIARTRGTLRIAVETFSFRHGSLGRSADAESLTREICSEDAASHAQTISSEDRA